MITAIPVDRSRKRWRIGRIGRYLGDLDIQYTFNMDLERVPGRIALGDDIRMITKDTDITGGFLNPQHFVLSNADNTNRWWAMATDKLLNTAGTNAFSAYGQNS